LEWRPGIYCYEFWKQVLIFDHSVSNLIPNYPSYDFPYVIKKERHENSKELIAIQKNYKEITKCKVQKLYKHVIDGFTAYESWIQAKGIDGWEIIYVYEYTYIYIYIKRYMHIYKYVYVCVYIYIYTCIYIYMYIYINIHKYVYVCEYTYIYKYIYTYIKYIYMFINMM
jgi:hypothetical protein